LLDHFTVVIIAQDVLAAYDKAIEMCD